MNNDNREFDRHTICHFCDLIIPWIESEAYPDGDHLYRKKMRYRARLCEACIKSKK